MMTLRSFYGILTVLKEGAGAAAEGVKGLKGAWEGALTGVVGLKGG